MLNFYDFIQDFVFTTNHHLKYKNVKKFDCFLGSDKPKMLFSPLINVKMPTIVGILTFMSKKKFHTQLS